MKIRTSFVSNSSSSSFVIYTKEELNKDKIEDLVIESLMETYGKDGYTQDDINILTNRIYQQIDINSSLHVDTTSLTGIKDLLYYLKDTDEGFDVGDIINILKSKNKHYLYFMVFGDDGRSDEHEDYLRENLMDILKANY